MNIGEAARAAGITAKMVRHYEAIGLIRPPVRTEARYRTYGEQDVHSLHFIRRARDLGFSLDEIAKLLALWHDRNRPSAEVRALAQRHIEALDAKARGLEAMSRTLQALVHACHGDDRPDCPILETLGR
jgi:Cu(I)-responsive transcriptional regulator